MEGGLVYLEATVIEIDSRNVRTRGGCVEFHFDQEFSFAWKRDLFVATAQLFGPVLAAGFGIAFCSF